MYENILVPTDGSDHADRGVDHAMDLAAEHDARLHVLFVVDDATERGIEATMSVLRGTPHETILSYADDQGIDVIVMGKRGAAGVESPHMGSVTNRVLRDARVPVVPV